MGASTNGEKLLTVIDTDSHHKARRQVADIGAIGYVWGETAEEQSFVRTYRAGQNPETDRMIFT